MFRKLLLFCFALGYVFSLVSCKGEREPEKIELRSDACHSCRMTIVDARFGGEVIRATGKVLKFDSIECLIRYLSQEKPENARIYLSDFETPGKFVEVEKSVIVSLKGESIGPMGSNLLAFRSEEQARAVLKNKEFAVQSFQDLQKK